MYIPIYMAVSLLFLYIKLTPVVPIDYCMSFVWNVVLCYVRDEVCSMCGL